MFWRAALMKVSQSSSTRSATDVHVVSCGPCDSVIAVVEVVLTRVPSQRSRKMCLVVSSEEMATSIVVSVTSRLLPTTICGLEEPNCPVSLSLVRVETARAVGE